MSTVSRKVSIKKCSSYEIETLYRSMEEAAELTDFPDVQGKILLLKPNLLSGSAPEKAVTTHPVFLQAAIRLFRSRGAGEIRVGDSCAVGDSRQAAEKAGFLAVCESEGVSWVDFSKTELLKNPEGVIHKQFYPAKAVQECDLIVSLPKMKTHAMMYFTGAMKNLFGVFPGLNKAQFHFRLPEKNRFAEMIVDLNQALKPAYALMDGIVAMEGHGPGNGDPRQVGLILASQNLLALDITASRIAGYQPLELPIHKAALARGIWLNFEEEIELSGEPLEVIHNFKRIQVLKDTGMGKEILPDGLYRFFTNIMVPRPHFIHRRCILCGKCVKICPPEALEIRGKKNKKVRIDYDKCIRCYCCDEVCPEKAIRISRI